MRYFTQIQFPNLAVLRLGGLEASGEIVPLEADC